MGVCVCVCVYVCGHFFFFSFSIFWWFRKRSPKSEDDGFAFPDINLEKSSDKCDLDSLRKQSGQKSTTTAPVTQSHVFAEPKPVSCIHFNKRK